MNIQQNQLKNLISTIVLIAISILCWYLLDEVPQSSDILSPAITIMLKIGIILAILIVLILTVNQLKTRPGDKSRDNRIREIIENTSIDTEQLNLSIIRLRQIQEPEYISIATALGTFLEQVLIQVESSSKALLSLNEQHLTLNNNNSELKEKYGQLIKAPRLRSEFLSRMGDEITSPMNSLDSMIKLLNDMEFEPEARDLLKIASHSAHSLIENLNNILEFSKLDVRRYQLQKSHFDVSESISSVLETLESIALSKALILQSQINHDVPEIIYGDKKAFSKVLDNMISNAIRFTDKGSIHLIVDYRPGDTKKLLRFTVSDTGVGIPDTALNSLFDSLERDTELINSSFAGRLRLIVSKQLCELMGGEIGVRSKQEVGSQFWFTIDISE